MMKPPPQQMKSKRQLLDEKKLRTDTLDALLVDTANRAADPLDTLSTQLALYVDDECETNGIDEPISQQRGAQRDVLNAPVYKRMLTVVNEKIDSYVPEKLKAKRGIGHAPLYRNELDLSPLRILTEHRRKLLLKSLCGFDDVDEKRNSARVGVENSFNLRECEMPTLPEEKVVKYFPSKNIVDSKESSSAKPNTYSKTMRKFAPKWDHYDVMRHRWISLQPATKRLVVNVEEYIPTSSVHNSIHVDSIDEPIQGRFVDSIHFDQTVQSIAQCKASRETRSRSQVSRSLTRGSELALSLSRGGLSTADSRKSSVYSSSIVSRT